MERIYIGLGSNLGDRLATLRSAVDELAKIGTIAARSSLWETEPVGPPPDFYNACVALEIADLGDTPEVLLDALLAIEARHGRVRDALRDAPRTLDLDILLWESRILHTPRMTVPHPRLAERGFVLHPLAEIAGEVVHPLLHRTIEGLRDDLPRSRRVRRLTDPL